MTFRAQATADLSTFLNVDEFGESVDIDGAQVDCVLEGNGDTAAPQDGVINRDTLLRARTADFAVVPRVGQRITVDGEQADVIAAADDQGLLTLQLRWLDS